MKITIVGCGNMGLIYARAFLKYKIIDKPDLLLLAKNESRKKELEQLDCGTADVLGNIHAVESDLVILCVKPQDFGSVVNDLKKILNEKNILISIMAGMKIEKIASTLNHFNIIRAMPNSPAELGMGMTAFTSSRNLSFEQIRKAENVLSTTGRTVYFENEELLDAATALSGSGPAYFFYLVKNMMDAGKQMGFDEATSTLLVKQTMLGSYHLLNTSVKSLDELIKTVASKGGTTEAAFKTFNQWQVGERMQEGILKACDRAKELSQSL